MEAGIDEARAKFASETGRTAGEWLAAWGDGALDQSDPLTRLRYECALELEAGRPSFVSAFPDAAEEPVAVNPQATKDIARPRKKR